MQQFLQARLPSRMPAARRFVVTLLAAAALAPSLLSNTAQSATQLVGERAPDFVLRSFANENLRLSEHLGEVVVLNFWATWCGPCRQEMPLLDEIWLKYRRAGLILFSVNVDEDRDSGIEMAQTLGVSYPVLFDERKDVSRSYRVGTLPVTVLIDREGVIRYVSDGYKPGYELRYTEKLRELLNQ